MATFRRSLVPRPTCPTASLPVISHLSKATCAEIDHALANLRFIYCPLPASRIPHRLLLDANLPDSGYASADDNEEPAFSSCTRPTVDITCAADDTVDIDIIRCDALERAFAIQWLTGFIVRSDDWVGSAPADSTEAFARDAAMEEATAILGSFTDAGPEDGGDVTRNFTFPRAHGAAVQVELNDALFAGDDHTAVGLQSWGSAIVLAERMCADPSAYGLSPARPSAGARILELGAGTGLLSIVTAKLLSAPSAPASAQPTIVATDYHPDVLANLRLNVLGNFASTPSASPPISIAALDWSQPSYNGALAGTFDVILAADVVYYPQHAMWIKGCVERLLVQPSSETRRSGVFWLIVPLRSTGRHEGISDTVEAVFPSAQDVALAGPRGCLGGGTWTLAIMDKKEAERKQGVGRADEGGYRLFRIGWV